MIRYLLGLADHVAAERRIRILTGALATAERDRDRARDEVGHWNQRYLDGESALARLRKERTSVRPKPNNAQTTALVQAIAEAQKHDISLTRLSDLSIEFLPETSPGRGRDIRVWWADSDHVIMLQLDVYGNGTGAFGEVSWVCDDGSDNQDCPTCEQAASGELTGVIARG